MKKLLIFALMSFTQFNFSGELKKRSSSERDLSNLTEDQKQKFISKIEEEQDKKKCCIGRCAGKFCEFFCYGLCGCLRILYAINKGHQIAKIKDPAVYNLEVMRLFENIDR